MGTKQGAGSVLVLSAVASERGDLPGFDVGVGPVRAGVSAGRIFAEEHPRAAILVGTAGAYPGGPAVGNVVVARRLGLERSVSEVGLGYAPLAPEPLLTDVELQGASGLPTADVFTVLAITTNPQLVAARSTGWQVEHMEAFAVALAAQDAGIPFAAVFGIANEVGPDAHAQWVANRERVEAKARDAVRAMLEGFDG